MIKILRIFNSAVKFLFYGYIRLSSPIITKLKFKLNGVTFKGVIAYGTPYVYVKDGIFQIGDNFNINSGSRFNIIGRQQRCYFMVWPGANLIIGNNVGISNSTIVCYDEIVIEDFVKIGGNVVIYDTDFHSVNASERNSVPEIYNTKTKKVLIKKGAFIGAHSTILKGVTVGVNSILGAGSVLTKSIPDFEIWGGNPAVFIKKINE